MDFYLRGLMLLRAQLEPAPAPPTTTRPTGAGAAAAESSATEESAAHPHAEDQQSTAQESTAGQSMASRRALFPASYTDNRGRKVWEMPTPVLIAVSQAGPTPPPQTDRYVGEYPRRRAGGGLTATCYASHRVWPWPPRCRRRCSSPCWAATRRRPTSWTSWRTSRRSTTASSSTSTTTCGPP